MLCVGPSAGPPAPLSATSTSGFCAMAELALYSLQPCAWVAYEAIAELVCDGSPWNPLVTGHQHNTTPFTIINYITITNITL